MPFDRHFTAPSRLSILVALVSGEAMSFTELKKVTELADGNLHTQAQHLVEAGYVERWKESREGRERTFYRISDRGFLALKLHTNKLQAALDARKLPVSRPVRQKSSDDDSRVW
jgi:DNA-binding MarR family transcriptional regulator